ncbi:MAG: hypothetical protein RL684_124 [Pseudomonadota bacterium]
MHFHGLDLNLLVALDALLEQGSVTAAGRKLHLSQSTMSSALARLRRHLGDPLLVQVGRRMDRTPFAQQLAGPVRSILLQVRASLRAPGQFDPATAQRRFALSASDYAVHMLLLAVQRHCARAAPGVVLDITSVTESSLEGLQRGELDLLVLPDRYRLKGCPATPLFRDRFVCVMDRDAAAGRSEVTLVEFKAAEHVIFQPDPGHVIAFDAWLREHYRFEPTVCLLLPEYALLPQAVVGTRHIATVPARLAQLYASYLPVQVLRPRFSIPEMVEVLQWHPARGDDPGLSWLRGLLAQCASALDDRAVAPARARRGRASGRTSGRVSGRPAGR